MLDKIRLSGVNKPKNALIINIKKNKYPRCYLYHNKKNLNTNGQFSNVISRLLLNEKIQHRQTLLRALCKNLQKIIKRGGIKNRPF